MKIAKKQCRHCGEQVESNASRPGKKTDICMSCRRNQGAARYAKWAQRQPGGEVSPNKAAYAVRKNAVLSRRFDLVYISAESITLAEQLGTTVSDFAINHGLNPRLTGYATVTAIYALLRLEYAASQGE